MTTGQLLLWSLSAQRMFQYAGLVDFLFVILSQCLPSKCTMTDHPRRQPLELKIYTNVSAGPDRKLIALPQTQTRFRGEEWEGGKEKCEWMRCYFSFVKRFSFVVFYFILAKCLVLYSFIISKKLKNIKCCRVSLFCFPILSLCIRDAIIVKRIYDKQGVGILRKATKEHQT